MYPLIVLAGPTASGKSEIALELAEYFDSEIISADSMQVYRHFNIGSGKPSADVLRRIRHHLINIIEPEGKFNAFEFRRLALEAARELTARAKIPLVVGGTGLYVKTMVEGFDCAAMVGAETCEKVQWEITRKGLRSVYSVLSRVDPIYAEKISPFDRLRVERAYSVYLETGKPYSSFHGGSNELEFEPYVFVLDWDRKDLYGKIERRVDSMFEMGWIEEVESLLARGYTREVRPFQGIGYTEIANYLERGTSFDQTLSEIKKETRRYAKRQLTWFRKTVSSKWIQVETNDSPRQLRDRILLYLSHLFAWWFVFFIGIFSAKPVESKTLFEEGVERFHKKDYIRSEKIFEELSYNNRRNSRPQALLLLGLARQGQNKIPLAIEAFEMALESYPELKDYSLYYIAESLFELKQYPKVVKKLDLLLSSFPHNRYKTEAEWMRVRALEAEGDKVKAIRLLADVTKRTPKSHRLLPEMIFKLAELSEDTGDYLFAHQIYREFFINYPAHSSSIRAESRMRQIRRLEGFNPKPLMEIDYLKRVRNLLIKARFEKVVKEIEGLEKRRSLVRGQFYVYKARALQALGKRTAADKAWNRFLKRYPHHPQEKSVQFQMARNLWNLGQDENAAAIFRAIIEGKSESEWSVRASYFLGKVYQGGGKTQKAIKEFSFLISNFSESDYAQDAAWRIGWLLYLEKKFSKAEKRFRANFERNPEGLMAEANLYWLGKTIEMKGKNVQAGKIYRELHDRFPFRYYGIRARARLVEMAAATQKNSEKSETWNLITSSPNKDTRPARPLLSNESNHRLNRAMDMLEMGLSENALYELKQVEPNVRKNFSGTIWLADLYNRAEGYTEAYRIMELYHKYKTKKHETELPVRFWNLYYPKAFGETILDQSRKQGVDPFWIRSVIRQESLFDHRSMSSAGARGLMQIMPDTARQLLDVDESASFDPDTLFNPQLNIRLGAKYLNRLKKKYSDNWIHILICYNAGPKALRKWLKRFRNVRDSDVFLEMIPYPETRKYIKLVFRNRGIYQALYKK